MFRQLTYRFSVLALFLLTIGLHAQDSDTCYECHGDESWTEDEATAGLYVDQSEFENSVHGFFSCVECHADLADQDPYGHASSLSPVDCSMCHPGVSEEYAGSLHAYARERGNERAPTCSGCHGTHDILPSSDPASNSHRQNLVDMCASCHGSSGLLTDQLIRLPQAVKSYARSVHGQAFNRGMDTAAVCSDCHGVHDLLGTLDPRSMIHPQNVSETCGKCHGDIQNQYDRSIHGRALAAGISDSPTCNDCHGEHLVLSPADPSADTFASRRAIETCGECHEDSRITEKYGLADYVVDTYVDSYHGWATQLDSPNAATCVECHTAHWVLPERDPSSTIHPGNVVETCRQCHPESDESFAQSYTHRTASKENNPVRAWISWIYLILIPATIGGMALHNGVIVAYYLRRRREQERSEGTVLRLDRMQVFQHALLALTFILLVITGFALRFPNAFWVTPLTALGLTEAVRSQIHRISAIGLLFAGALHVAYILLNARGRQEFVAMIPRWRDVTDLLGNLRYYLGLTREKVDFARYDYTQKAEYWALVWGTVVMAVSGFVLWFPATFVQYFPWWIVSASEVLHYYEAWLATLAIIVWHFFFVIFHPEVYPMSWIWLTGEMSEKEVRHHHGDWYEELKDEGKV